MANFILKRGNLANLAGLGIQDGQFIVVKDERSIYVDVGTERIRLGDFQEFASIAALNNNVNPSTTALYYVSDVNVLAKWDGSKYVQINTDTGMTSVEVVGEGNAVTGASYNAETRKLTLTKGVSFATDADHQALAKKVNDLEVVGGQANVIESVKVNGTALEVAADKSVDIVLGDLAGKDIVEKSDLSASVQASLDLADSAIQEHQDISHLAVKADVETALAGKVAKEEGKSLIADSEIARLLTLANYDDTQVKADIKANTDAIDAIEADYLKAADIASFETKENVKKVADGLAAYVTSNNAALEAVSVVAEAATTVDEVNSQIDTKIAALNLGETYEAKGTAASAIEALNLAATYEPIGAEARAKSYVDGKFTEANLAQYTTEDEVKSIVDGVIAGAADSETYNSLSKLVDYIDAHGGEAAEMAEAISTLEGQVKTIEEKPAYSITAIQISNWDNEVGAKALAETKTTAADVKVQIEAYGYATESDLTAAEGRISTLETNSATKTELGNVDAKFANYRTSAAQDVIDNEIKASIKVITDDYVVAADIANFETKGTAASLIEGLDLANTYEAKGEAAKVQSNLESAVSTINGTIAGVKATADAAAVKTEVESALNGKVDKVEGYSLISDTEIARLADVDNYDDTALAGRVSALEAVKDDYKAYADQAEADAVATAKAYTDAALAWSEF